MYIPIAQPSISGNEKKYILSCLKSTWISSAGEFIDRFENSFAQFIDTKYAITTSNGTTALHLALLALGIGPGDEVIVPALTFVTTANVVTYTGAKPVFVDIDKHSWNMDPTKIENSITKKTRAIIPVHLYGYPADMNKIMRIARMHKLFVIEDAAEAHGALIQRKKVGAIGDIGCFSFFGNKIMTTGEGGMITTNSKKLSEKIRLLKNHGMDKKRPYYHPIIGYNYRLTNLQAALGLAQLEQIKKLLAKRTQIAKIYENLLSQIPGIVLQPKEEEVSPVCWLFSLRITQSFGTSSKKVITHLKKHGIDARPFFITLPKLPMYQTKKQFPIADQVSQEGINLPTFVGLTKKQQQLIVRVLQNTPR